eukprot:1484092-Rhodomonas_salina.1
MMIFSTAAFIFSFPPSGGMCYVSAGHHIANAEHHSRMRCVSTGHRIARAKSKYGDSIPAQGLCVAMVTEISPADLPLTCPRQGRRGREGGRGTEGKGEREREEEDDRQAKKGRGWAAGRRRKQKLVAVHSGNVL